MTQPQLPIRDQAIHTFEAALSVLLLLCLGRILMRIVSWPLIGDASLIHYAVFLIDHGKAPYRDIQEINMPGAYFIDWLVMHLLGTGAIAWHIFDIVLVVSTFIAGLFVALPYDWFAGLFACALFGMIHARDGMTQSGQRDLSIAVLALFSYALVFLALRTGKRWPVFCSGLLASLATLVKPVAVPLGLGILCLSLIELRRRKQPLQAHLLLGCGGFLVPMAILGALLFRWHSFTAFLDIQRGPVLYHASLARLADRTLLARIASQILPLLGGSLAVLPAARKLFNNWEYQALLVGTLAGALCYLLQGKGYSYQRYPFEIFVLLLVGLILAHALRQKGWPQIVAAATLLYGCLVLAPVSAAKALHYDGSQDDFGALLEQDLSLLGGSKLNHQVQCLDTFSGCIRVLYQMKLVQSTGLIYDEFIFGPEKDGIVASSREAFWKQLQSQPPSVFVVTEQVYPDGPPNLDKVSSWPLLADDLRRNYFIYAERHPHRPQAWEGKPNLPAAYRIYVRRF
jgi:hypothetical protein